MSYEWFRTIDHLYLNTINLSAVLTQAKSYSEMTYSSEIVIMILIATFMRIEEILSWKRRVHFRNFKTLSTSFAFLSLV